MYEIYCKLRDAKGMKDADVARKLGLPNQLSRTGRMEEAVQKTLNYKK